MRLLAIGMISLSLAFSSASGAQGRESVGKVYPDSRNLMPTGQFIRPAGTITAYGARPVDLVVLPGAAGVVLKDNLGLTLVGPPAEDRSGTWEVRAKLPLEDGTSMHGIVRSKDGTQVFVTDAASALLIANLSDGNALTLSRSISLPGVGEAASYPCGVVLSQDESTAYVCLSMKNCLAVVELASGDVTEIATGVAPYAVVLSPDAKRAYVSNWGGRRPVSGETTATSAGTEVVVDDRGIATTGSVSFIDLAEKKETASIPVGLHPSDMALTRDGATLYIANSNDDTVSIVDTATATARGTVNVRPDPGLPFGSAPTALALDEERGLLYCALGGNNAVAMLSLKQASLPVATGFIPAGWYPGALALAAETLFVANVKGYGARDPHPEENGWKVHWHNGLLQRVALPLKAEHVADYSAQVATNGFFPQVLRALEREKAVDTIAPVPVPATLGHPSVFEHVVYIIKENRTYDQVFGDLPQGNGDPSLCIFPRAVTPNQHALAEEFALLDNWYCNGVNSADGHAWSTEGNVTDYLEKSFGGFTRSYTWGDDPLSYSSSGFIWDKVLSAGLSFRNYGEFDYAEPVPKDATFARIYEDFTLGTGKITFAQKIGLGRIRDYTCREYPGWNMDIPDVLRASVFLKELAAFEQNGQFPNFSIVYLPQDHTSGTTPDRPTPAAHVADNDLALGQIVDGISKSRFWPKTCIFVVEDDPQAGFDHVDGHRSVCLVVSPYTKRGAVVSEFYNQTSVLHTMARVLGVPPLNQMDALAPLMTTCFDATPNLTPYDAKAANIPLDQLNPPKAALSDKALHWAEQSLAQNFAEVDAGDEDTLNRILWHAMKGVDAPYPADFAGAHGKGLADLKLLLVGDGEDEDD